MRARIIFRGLTLFTSEKRMAGAREGSNLGAVTAHLVNDRRHRHMPPHTHTPYLGLIGRDRGSPLGSWHIETKRRIRSNLTISLQGHGGEDGVITDGTFLDYVPLAENLHSSKRKTREPAFDVVSITIPRGRIRTRDFITWDWYGNTPARIGYMGSTHEGFGANEVVVDVGDDSDAGTDDDAKFLLVQGASMHEELWPRVKEPVDDDVEPNVVEIVISNLPARRARSVPWGMHFQTLFDYLGYERVDYAETDQYRNFLTAATQFDAGEWQYDFDAMGLGYPFPFIIDPDGDRLTRIAGVTRGTNKVEVPRTHGRQKGDMPPSTGGHDHHGHGGAHQHDPANTQVCPFVRKDGDE
jgi:hypothetical protein